MPLHELLCALHTLRTDSSRHTCINAQTPAQGVAHLSGHKVPVLHGRVQSHPQPGARLDFIPEKVPRGEVGVAILLLDEGTLGPLATPGAPQYKHCMTRAAFGLMVLQSSPRSSSLCLTTSCRVVQQRDHLQGMTACSCMGQQQQHRHDQG